MKSFIKPGEKGSLISKEAQAELERQDAARARARATASSSGFRSNFMASIAYEFDLANRWGAEATMSGNEVSVRIPEKYPRRKIGRFETWFTSLRGYKNTPLFQFPPCKNLRGVIFNEGGRGVTLTWTRWMFRLYVAGAVLMQKNGKWSLRVAR